MNTLEDFKKAGMTASYHFADDTTKEWGLAKKEEAEALRIFDENPALQPEMREIAKGFLWSLKSVRGE